MHGEKAHGVNTLQFKSQPLCYLQYLAIPVEPQPSTPPPRQGLSFECPGKPGRRLRKPL